MIRSWNTLATTAKIWRAARSPRERALLALMAAFGACALAFKAQDDVVFARSTAEEAIVASAVTTGLTREQRAVFAAATDGAARQVRQASIGGETIHIARARAQSVVASLARQAGIEGVTTVVQSRDARKAKGGPVEAIEVTVIGAYDKAALARFLQALSVSEHSLSPLSMTVRAGDASRLEMRIAAYALVDGDET